VSWSSLRPDTTPLRGPGARGFRAVFLSRTAVYLGSQAAEVALLVQAQRLTGSPLVVGTLGLAELVPLLIFGLYGGVLADRFDRRALMRWSEPQLTAATAILSLSVNMSMLIGSSLGGVLAVAPGPWLVYALDAVGFGVSFVLLSRGVPALPPMVGGDGDGAPAAAASGGPALSEILVGLRYAYKRKDLLGAGDGTGRAGAVALVRAAVPSSGGWGG
jgi:hypothetical protein